MEEYLINKTPLTWDYKKWVAEFKQGSKSQIGFRVSRKKVFDHTVEVIKAGQYVANGKTIMLKDFTDLLHIWQDSKFYPDTHTLVLPEITTPYITAYQVIQADCIEVGQTMQKLGFNPVVLNMANGNTPGGAVIRGAGAQEENLFRRSNLYTSLYQYADFAPQYGIHKHGKHRYPIPAQAGGIYSPDVLFFRSSEHSGYALLAQPFTLSIVTVPAIAHPKVESRNGRNWLTPPQIEFTKHKIRTILKMAALHQHDCLILSAFGCGAFKNPPHHMAQLFKEVLAETDFNERFKSVIFAIIDDHNAWKAHNPEGNLIPFQQVFD
ncbi:TIGR02452 family protein [Microscilla marina]|nr:TIGR02452 family protein [Microscilla marina]